MKEGRRQRKTCKDNIREWTHLEFGMVLKSVDNREKPGRSDCKVISDSPMTIVLKFAYCDDFQFLSLFEIGIVVVCIDLSGK